MENITSAFLLQSIEGHVYLKNTLIWILVEGDLYTSATSRAGKYILCAWKKDIFFHYCASSLSAVEMDWKVS